MAAREDGRSSRRLFRQWRELQLSGRAAIEDKLRSAAHPSTWIVSEAQDFLRRRDTRKPFFLYLGFHRPHPPYDPPQWAFDQYLGVEMPPPPVGDWVEEVLDPLDDSWRADPNISKLSGHAYQRARAGYFGHISHIDLLLNRFLETLAEYNLRSNTVVCFVSDHGEMLGDHHAFRKTLPYEGSARVPFLLSGPGIPSRKVVDDKVIELRDVMPTLLDAAGLAPPPGLDGNSALGLATGDDALWREFLHGEHTGFGQSIHYLTDGRHKYVWWSGTGREQLFDLQTDPQECRDLTHSATLPIWRGRLIECLGSREEGLCLTAARSSQALPPCTQFCENSWNSRQRYTIMDIMSPDEQIKDVLRFFADHTRNRPLIYEEIAKTANRWDDLQPEQKVLLFERCRRRFSAVHPPPPPRRRIEFRDAHEALRS